MTGTGYHQDELDALRSGIKGDRLPLGLLPEPDNPHDPHAVAVIAAGLSVGYLRRDYARLWHPVVVAEHSKGRRVVGDGWITDVARGIGLTAKFVQPAPVLRLTPSSGPPVPAVLDEYWPVRRRRTRARPRPVIGTVPMTRVEHLLYDHLMQCPEPFFFLPQYPLGRLRLDFYCARAALCVEVDGPEHRLPARAERDARRNHVLTRYGIATYRLSNAEVEADPKHAAELVFKRACKRRQIYVHTNPRSPFYGWRPIDLLRPG